MVQGSSISMEVRQNILVLLAAYLAGLMAATNCGGSTTAARNDGGAPVDDGGDIDVTVATTRDAAPVDAPVNFFAIDGPCSPSTCPNGCCNGDTCVVPAPSSPGFCGGHGNACIPCMDGGYVPDAECSPANCPTGCCNASGFCVDPPTDEQCGTQGDNCGVCPNGGSCVAGALCQWPVASCGVCTGCCQTLPDGGAQCMTGTFALLCGNGGAFCTPCGPYEQCRAIGFDGGGYCQANSTCDPTNCPGCCVGDICAEGTQNQACGFGGISCAVCGSGGSCYNGRCAFGGPRLMPKPGADGG
jgi:hypothetical protein